MDLTPFHEVAEHNHNSLDKENSENFNILDNLNNISES